ncbi:MAG: hypothetical protein LLG97_02265 [Deltaproteobacteria bacterium]|nr:hypothetical protein [Deltaproteobacteria bacterium]
MPCENESLKRLLTGILREQSAKDALIMKALYDKPETVAEFVYHLESENGDVMEIHDFCWIQCGSQNENVIANN